MESKLANWVGGDRKKLVRQLMEAVKPSAGPQKLFFDELIRRLVANEFATLTEPVKGIDLEEAARIMGVHTEHLGPSPIYTVANRVKEKIEEGSKSIQPDPGASLSHVPYSIEVKQNPPSFDKMYTEPCIGLILADAKDWFVGDVLKGISKACDGKYDLIVELSNDSPQTEAKIIRSLAEKVHGLLIVPVSERVVQSAMKSLRDNPCVLIDRYFRNTEMMDCVHPADRAAGHHAARQLKELGCQRIIVVTQGSRVGTKFAITPLEDRVVGCQEAYEDDELRVVALASAGTDEQGGLRALELFEADKLNEIVDGDGILALTDRLAVGCSNYLRTCCPEKNVRLISIEGQSFGEFTEPPLLSIKFDNFEMGRLAAATLIAKIEGKTIPGTTPPKHHLIAPKLLRPTATGKREEVALSLEV